MVRYNIRDFDYNMVRMETELDEVTDSFSGQNEVMLLIAKLTAMRVWRIPWTADTVRSSRTAG